MRSPPATKRRPALLLELLEQRLAPTASTTLSVPLNTILDQFGDQVVTVQAYQDPSRTAFGIFDTGASPITFSDGDQDNFEAKGVPIPVVAPGGASAQGIGGLVVGDLSKPGTILADGLHAAHLTIDPSGTPQFSVAFGSGSASVPGIQAIIGTDSSASLPTLTGTSILKPTPSHPHGLAAQINMQGVTLDFSSIVPGLTITLPDLHFVDAGTPLASNPSFATDPVSIPLSVPANPSAAGTSGSPSPVQGDVKVVKSPITLLHQKYLFDTGAQVTVISTAEATALGLDLFHPTTSITVGGVGGSEVVPGYILDEIDLPRSDGGVVRFTHVPVYVLDVGNGVDGILGMNLFNTAGSVQYDPYNPAGPSFEVTFLTNPTRPGGSATTVASIHQLGIPFAGSIDGTGLPVLTINPGQISGEVFYDYNRNGIVDRREPGIAGQTVYQDTNNNGTLDPGELATTTNPDGFYQFSGLLPGTYTVREVVAPTTILVSPPGGSITVTVQSSATTSGVNFGNIPSASASTPTASFVVDVYGDVLDRAPDVGGMNTWVQTLQGGVSQEVVGQRIWESSEHRALQVESYYETYLHRQGDLGGVANWVNAFASGTTEIDVQRSFLGSAEYQAAHPDNTSFVSGLYQDVLGRPADAAGLSGWAHALQSGTNRSQVAQQILTSREAYLLAIDGYYQTLLHRPADWPGAYNWLTNLQQGTQSLDGIAEALLASGEYFTLAGQQVAGQPGSSGQ